METPARCAGCKPRSETLFWLTHDNLEAIVYLWSHRCLSLQPRSSCSDRVTHRSPCEMCTKGNKKNVYVMGLKFFWLRNMDTTWNNSVTWTRGAIRHERNTASRYLIAWYVGFRYGMSIRQDRVPIWDVHKARQNLLPALHVYYWSHLPWRIMSINSGTTGGTWAGSENPERKWEAKP